MLNIYFGRESLPKGSKFVLDPRKYFLLNKKPVWFEDPFIKKVIKGVDEAEVMYQEALKDKFGNGISSMVISTGCKTLCSIYFRKYDDEIFYGTGMGDNCVPYLMEIAASNDISIVLEHEMDIPDTYFKAGLIFSSGRVISSKEEYTDLFNAYARKITDYYTKISEDALDDIDDFDEDAFDEDDYFSDEEEE